MSSAKEGYLTKLGAKFPTWRRRYFVLIGSKLYYFKTLKDRRNNRVQGTISLTGSKCNDASHVDKEFAFGITPLGSKRTYLICAGSAHERDEWIKIVNKHSSEAMSEQFSGLKREENSLREGYLTKLGHKVKNWKRRYFVLSDNVLKYYATKSDEQPLGTIVLLGSRIQLEEKSIVGVDHALSVTVADGRRRYIMFADTAHDRMLWYDAIKKCRVFNSNFEEIVNNDGSDMKTGDDHVIAAAADVTLHPDVESTAAAAAAALAPESRLTTLNVVGQNRSGGANIKQKVSKKKRRFVLDGFDLDLTYITDRIIAMGFPSENIESIYRNSMSEVRRFLNTRHSNSYRVYNLCAERSYDPSKFDGRVVRFPFDDHNCPRFEDLVPLVEDMHKWLQADPSNVCVVHCKAGKGRTGLIICVYLLFSGAWSSAQEALSYYAYVRTKDQKGVTIPSQRRWVYYFEKFMERKKLGKAIPDRGPIALNEIFVSKRTRAFDLVEISNNGVKHTSKHWGKYWKQPVEGGGFLIKPPKGSVKMHRDIKIDFFSTGLMGKKTRLWSFWVNTCFIDDDYLALDKTSLDKVNKDSDVPHFRVEVFFGDREKKRGIDQVDQAASNDQSAAATTITGAEHLAASGALPEYLAESDEEDSEDSGDGDADGQMNNDDDRDAATDEQRAAVAAAMENLNLEHDHVYWWGREEPVEISNNHLPTNNNSNDDDDDDTGFNSTSSDEEDEEYDS